MFVSHWEVFLINQSTLSILSIFNIYTLMHHHQLLHTDITNKGLIGLHSLFKVIGSSFVAIFIPAILYTQFGFTIGQVFLFTAVHSITAIALEYRVSASFVARQWTKPSMMIGVVAFMVYMILLALWDSYPLLILLTPLFLWIHTAFFRMGYHVSMGMSSKEKDLWKKIAWLESVGVVAAMIGPIIGWVLTDVFGTEVLFTAAAIAVLASLVPLRLDDHAHTPVTRSPKQELLKSGLSLKDSLKEYVPLIAPFSGLWYLQFVWSIVRSIVLFLHFDSFTKVWIISSITSIAVLLAVWRMGKSSDEKKWVDHSLMKRSVRLQATTRWVIWIALLTSFFSNVVFMMADAFHKISFKLSMTYLNKQMYAHKMDEDESMMVVSVRKALLHEAWIHLFRAIMCVILSIVSLFISDTLFFFAIPMLLVIIFVPMQLLFPKDVKQIES